MPETHILEVTVDTGEVDNMEGTLKKYIEVSMGVKQRGIRTSGNTVKIFLNTGDYNKKEIAESVSRLDYVEDAYFSV